MRSLLRLLSVGVLIAPVLSGCLDASMGGAPGGGEGGRVVGSTRALMRSRVTRRLEARAPLERR